MILLFPVHERLVYRDEKVPPDFSNLKKSLELAEMRLALSMISEEKYERYVRLSKRFSAIKNDPANKIIFNCLDQLYALSISPNIYVNKVVFVVDPKIEFCLEFISEYDGSYKWPGIIVDSTLSLKPVPDKTIMDQMVKNAEVLPLTRDSIEFLNKKYNDDLFLIDIDEYLRNRDLLGDISRKYGIHVILPPVSKPNLSDNPWDVTERNMNKMRYKEAFPDADEMTEMIYNYLYELLDDPELYISNKKRLEAIKKEGKSDFSEYISRIDLGNNISHENLCQFSIVSFLNKSALQKQIRMRIFAKDNFLLELVIKKIQEMRPHIDEYNFSKLQWPIALDGSKNIALHNLQTLSEIQKIELIRKLNSCDFSVVILHAAEENDLDDTLFRDYKKFTLSPLRESQINRLDLFIYILSKFKSFFSENSNFIKFSRNIEPMLNNVFSADLLYATIEELATTDVVYDLDSALFWYKFEKIYNKQELKQKDKSKPDPKGTWEYFIEKTSTGWYVKFGSKLEEDFKDLNGYYYLCAIINLIKSEGKQIGEFPIKDVWNAVHLDKYSEKDIELQFSQFKAIREAIRICKKKVKEKERQGTKYPFSEYLDEIECKKKGNRYIVSYNLSAPVYWNDAYQPQGTVQSKVKKNPKKEK